MAFQIPAFDPNSTVGALEVGALAAVFLFGVVTLQVYIYYHQFPEDSWYIKTLVAFVWILELGHSIALCHYLYTVSVTQYGKPLLLLIPPKSVDIAILIGGFLGPIEQGWFIRRLYVFSKNMFLTSISTLLSLTRFTGTCALAGIAFGMGPINEFIEDWRWLILLVLIVGAMTDLLLATTLWYYLMQWRQRSDKNMSKILNSLSVVAIESGFITSLGAFGLLVTFLTLKTTFIWIGVFMVIPKLFSNSLLASLNLRRRFAREVSNISGPSAGRYTTPSNPASRVGQALTTDETEGTEMRVASRNHQHRMARIVLSDAESQTPVLNWKAGGPDWT